MQVNAVRKHPIDSEAVYAAAISSPSSDGGAASKRKARRVLIIEDDLDNARLLAYLLSMSGYTVEYAINGIVGLELAHRLLPHVAIVDLKLPDTHGAEIIRQLRRNPELKSARIIAVTGSKSPADLIRAASAGADELLTKPVPVKTLEGLIDSTL